MKQANNIKSYLDIIAASGKYGKRQISRALAKEVGVSPQAANYWLTNKVAKPKDAHLDKIVVFINLNLPDGFPRIRPSDLVKFVE